ncbi:MAG: site-2 protease family protein [Acidimicrobiia bacterium]|nr:site-2 protease family protein [Acidimicrobiia bacterium]
MDKHRGSVRIGRFAGTEVYIHWTWVIIAALIVLGFQARLETVHPGEPSGWLLVLSLVGAIIFFGSVLVHELAHAIVAQTRGIENRGITLYLFGGATEADASSRRASDEFVIAIAGPITSVLIALALAGIAGALAATSQPDALVDLVAYLAVINMILAAFNMTPGLPLDGGRVFRSIVWAVTGDFRRATSWAATGGVVVGYVLAGLGLLLLWQGALGGLWFAAIGWMIAQSARRTEEEEELRQTLRGQLVADVMTSPVIAIPASTSIGETLTRFFARYDQTIFPVVERRGDGHAVVGMLDLARIRRLDPERRRTKTAADLATEVDEALIVKPSTPVLEIIDELANPRARALVIDRGLLVGIISPRDILRRSRLAPLLDETAAGAR